MGKHLLHEKLKANKGNGNRLAKILLKVSALLSTAKGCQLYVVSKSKEEEDTIFVTEI